MPTLKNFHNKQSTTNQLPHNMNKDLLSFYHRRVAHYAALAERLRKRNKLFMLSSFLSFMLIPACIGFYASADKGQLWLMAGLLAFLLYLAIRYLDNKNGKQIEHAENLLSVYEKEEAYQQNNFSRFGSGEQYIDPRHAFTYDLDIFGSGSLFQRMNRTITTGGSDTLAGYLADVRMRPVGEIEKRREAIRELAECEPLRAAFCAHGQKHIINTAEILSALNTIKDIRISKFALSRLSLGMAGLGIGLLAVTTVLAATGNLSPVIPVAWAVIQLFAVQTACARSLGKINKVVGKMHTHLRAYISLIRLIAASDLKAAENREIITAIAGKETDAIASFEQLSRLLDGLDQRSNIMGLILFNSLFASDYFLVRRFLKWQVRYMPCIEDWIAAVSRFDALVSLATYRYNEPQAVDAEIVDEEQVVYRAEGIYHPFLGEKAVSNNFCIDDRHYYIITGANMAGKSTFLRTIGVNYLLAVNGLPVFADRLTVSVFSLFTGMRTTDDLNHGISYFNAELLRLKQLMESCRRSPRTLIILDEILKGTNSLDKLNGSRLFLQEIATLAATGIIATHDLELSKMADAMPDRFHNHCFEIQLSTDITYTYKITPGVARNQNATYLLRKMLLTH